MGSGLYESPLTLRVHEAWQLSRPRKLFLSAPSHPQLVRPFCPILENVMSLGEGYVDVQLQTEYPTVTYSELFDQLQVSTLMFGHCI